MSAILGQVVGDRSDTCYAAHCLRFGVSTSGETLERALDNLRRAVREAIADDRSIENDVLLLVTVRTQRYESVIAEPLFTTFAL